MSNQLPQSTIELPVSWLEQPHDMPRYLVFSGASGAGKGTIIGELKGWLNQSGTQYKDSVSKTTREQRVEQGEVNGEHYHFVSREDFERDIAAGNFIESEQFAGNYYGTPMPEGEDPLLLEIEVNGAKKVYDYLQTRPGASFQYFYIAPPNCQELWRRLTQRDDGVPIETKIERFATFVEIEIPLAKELPFHVVINDDKQHAVSSIALALSGQFSACLVGGEKHAFFDALQAEGAQMLAQLASGLK